MTATLALDQTPAPRLTWRQPLPRLGPVTRDELLLELCRGKRVVHIGFVDDRLLDERLSTGAWLHARLSEVARSLVGIDCAFEGVHWAVNNGFEAYVADAQSAAEVVRLGLDPADVVLAGEVIEHLDAPGPFLRAMRHLCSDSGTLVVTTPNAYRPLNVLTPLLGFELIHPDHAAWHSPHTLRRLHERNGWAVETICYYQNPPQRPVRDRGIGRLLSGLAAGAVGRVSSRLVPAWCDGLIVCSRPTGKEVES